MVSRDYMIPCMIFMVAQCQALKLYWVVLGYILFYYHNLQPLYQNLVWKLFLRSEVKNSCHLKRSPELAHIPIASLRPNSDVSLSFLHLQSGIFSEVWSAVTHCFHSWFTNSLICSISLRAVLFLTGRLEGDDDLKCQEDFLRGHRGWTMLAPGHGLQSRFGRLWNFIYVFS